MLYKYWPLFSGLVQLALDYILNLCHVEFFPVAGADEHENWSREQQCAAWRNGKWLCNLLSGVFLLIIISNSKKITANCMTALCKMSVEIKHEYNPCLVGWQMKCKVLLFVYWLPKHEMNDYLCLRGSPRFPVISVFLFVIHLCKQWKAEHVTEGHYPITSLPLKNYVAPPSPFETQRCTGASLGGWAPLLDMTGQVQTHSPTCKPLHWELLLPSSKMFLTHPQGVGGGVGFTELHPGLPRCGCKLSPLPDEGRTSIGVRRLWDRSGLGRDILFVVPAQRCEEAAGRASPARTAALTAGCQIGGVLDLLCALHGPANSMGKLAWAVKTKLISQVWAWWVFEPSSNPILARAGNTVFPHQAFKSLALTGASFFLVLICNTSFIPLLTICFPTKQCLSANQPEEQTGKWTKLPMKTVESLIRSVD